MNILFMYDGPLIPEKGGTERITKLVMDALSSRGHHTIGFLHFNQSNPDEFFLNNEHIDDLSLFLQKYKIDVVVNQLAYNIWLLRAFLNHGGREWKDAGGIIISVMHFDPHLRPFMTIYQKHFYDYKDKNIYGKILRILLLFYKPIMYLRNRSNVRKWYKQVYLASDYYIMLTEKYFKYFIHMSGIKDCSKLRAIPNMLTFPQIETKDILNHKQKIVLVICRMDEIEKHVSLIIKIWHKMKQHHGYILKLVGEGDDLVDYKHFVNKYHVQDISFEGQQSPLPYYQQSQIFVMTSRHEGWGLTITESMQNGVVPIVLNTSAVFSDIIENGVSGFLPNTPNELLKKMELLMTDKKIREAMAINCLERSKRFAATNVGEIWDLLFKRIV